MQATSRHVRMVTELTLIAPIKPGFIDHADVMSHATRLHVVLNALFELRRAAIEVEALDVLGPLESLRSIYEVRFALIDGETRLLLGVSFDRSWESYIQGIVDRAGPLLDLIFSHCEDYEGHECKAGYLAFSSWVRERQVACDFFYAASPDLTVDDQRFLTDFVRTGSGGIERAARVQVAAPAERATENMGLRALAALYDVSKWFQSDRDKKLWDELARVTTPLLRQLDPRAVDEPVVRGWLQTLQANDEQPDDEPAKPAAALPAGKSSAVPKPPDANTVRQDVQANVLTSRPEVTHGLTLLLKCDTAETLRVLLAWVAKNFVSEADPAQGTFYNLGLTCRGMRYVLSESEQRLLPKEFLEGMSARAGLLGDTGPENSPEGWQLPLRNVGAGQTDERVSLDEVDAVLIIQGTPEAKPNDHLWSDVHPLCAELRELQKRVPGVEVLHVQPLRRHFTPAKLPRDHFGYADGLSQPAPQFPGEVNRGPARDSVALGEFLIGHADARGKRLVAPQLEGPLANGSFMVLRKLEQNVAAFETFTEDNASTLRLTPVAIKSAILGRDAETNRPLVTPGRDSNDFDYASDPVGARCPLHAHIRRANPRPSDPEARKLTPRVLRRGMSYGPRTDSDQDGERGLLFIAYNASIAQQFEVIQRWINGGNSSGGFSGQSDLLAGTSHASTGPYYIDARGTAQELTPPRVPLVRLCWGLYLFVPGRKTLEAWSGMTAAAAGKRAPDAPQLQLERGKQLLRLLRKHNTREAWKKLLEDIAAVEERAALWTAIREAEGGVLRTPYGVLVGTAPEVQKVLYDDQFFSVCEYGKRMKSTVGIMHLGLDVSTEPYGSLSKLPNEFVYRELDEAMVYERTHALTTAALGQRHELQVERLAVGVLMQLAAEWFGLPRYDEVFWDLLSTSKYVFQPRPGDWLADDARGRGKRLRDGFRKLADECPAAERSQFLAYLVQHGVVDKAQQATAMFSLTSGFFAATLGTTVATLDSWIESGELWRLPHERAQLEQSLLEQLRRRQGPVVLYRTCRKRTRLGKVEVKPNDLIVVGPGSAAIHDPDSRFSWFFGGEVQQPAQDTTRAQSRRKPRRKGRAQPRPEAPAEPRHACPAQKMALAVMLGLMGAILDRRNLKRERRMVLSYAPAAAEPPGGDQGAGSQTQAAE